MQGVKHVLSTVEWDIRSQVIQVARTAHNSGRTALHTALANGSVEIASTYNGQCRLANLEVRHSPIRESQRALAVHVQTSE